MYTVTVKYKTLNGLRVEHMERRGSERDIIFKSKSISTHSGSNKQVGERMEERKSSLYPNSILT
jgi:hypothetical protein